jgi:two-component system, LuxR family, response regulator FixJ
MGKENLFVLIDDDEMILESLEGILSTIVDDIVTYSNPIEAMSDLKDGKITPVCVICDINMPEASGFDVLHSFRSHNKETPFYFFTGHGNFIEDEVKAVNGLLTGIFHKPSIAEVLTMVKNSK